MKTRVLQVLRVLLILSLTGACARSAAPVPLSSSFDTKEAAAQAALDAVWTRDSAALGRLSITQTEFQKHIWPQLPASAPDVGMPVDRAWADHLMKDDGFRAQLITEHSGRRLMLESIRFNGRPTTYGSFTIHPDTRVTVFDRDQRLELRLWGSMIESGGRWKIYSFIVD